MIHMDLLPVDLGDGITLHLTTVNDTEEAFAAVDAGRDRLAKWLPWVDATTTVDIEREFLEHVKGSHEGILKEIRESKKLSEELEEKLEKVVNDFKKGFDTTDGSSVVPDEHVDAMDEGDVEKESVKVKKPEPKDKDTKSESKKDKK